MDGPAQGYGERLLDHPPAREWSTLVDAEPMVIEQADRPRR